jgi:hypothetical protein
MQKKLGIFAKCSLAMIVTLIFASHTLEGLNVAAKKTPQGDEVYELSYTSRAIDPFISAAFITLITGILGIRLPGNRIQSRSVDKNNNNHE